MSNSLFVKLVSQQIPIHLPLMLCHVGASHLRAKREADNPSPACLELPVKAASIFCQIFLGTMTKRDNKVGNMFLCLLLSLIFTIKHPTKISNSPAKMHYHMQYTRN